MSTVTKQATIGDGLTHTHSSFIAGAQVDPNDPTTAYVEFSTITGFGSAKSNGTSRLLRADKGAYRRITTGGGSQLEAFRAGLKGASRYNFIIVTSGKGKDEMVVNVHAYPHPNYIECDLSEQLHFNVAPTDAVVQLHSNGDIDVMAFPVRMYRRLGEFIAELEKRTKIKDDDVIKVGSGSSAYTATVQNIVGSRVTFMIQSQP